VAPVDASPHADVVLQIALFLRLTVLDTFFKTWRCFQHLKFVILWSNIFQLICSTIFKFCKFNISGLRLHSLQLQGDNALHRPSKAQDDFGILEVCFLPPKFAYRPTNTLKYCGLWNVSSWLYLLRVKNHAKWSRITKKLNFCHS